jgi:hypothetical protein
MFHVNAQLKPLAAAFYQNQYLINPAMAGVQGGTSFDLSYRTQLNSVPGALKEQALTGTYSFDKAAIGLNVILNLNNFMNRFKRDQINYSTFFTAISYKFNAGKEYGDVGLEPKLCYRGIKEADGILDAGVNVVFAQDRFNVYGLYHTSENATFGFGIKYKTLSLSGIYSSVPYAFRGYTNGDFELGLGIRL